MTQGFAASLNTTLSAVTVSATAETITIQNGSVSAVLQPVTTTAIGLTINQTNAEVSQVLGDATTSANGLFVKGTIETAIRAILLADTTVAGYLGLRIYPVRTPDNTQFPCATYERLSADRQHTLDGAGNLSFSRYLIEVWTQRTIGGEGGFDQATRISTAIRKALDGFRGYSQGVDIQGVLSENESHGWESDVEVYRVTQNWLVMHRE